MSFHENHLIPQDLLEKLDSYITGHFIPEQNIGVPISDDFRLDICRESLEEAD